MRNPKKLYHFYHDHNYNTEECHALKKYSKIDLQRIPSTISEEGDMT
jgi:hypothetical protein